MHKLVIEKGYLIMMTRKELKKLQTVLTSLNDCIQSETLPMFSTINQVWSYQDLLIGLRDTTQEISNRFNDLLDKAYAEEVDIQ